MLSWFVLKCERPTGLRANTCVLSQHHSRSSGACSEEPPASTTTHPAGWMLCARPTLPQQSKAKDLWMK
jgi:hypothetical protein